MLNSDSEKNSFNKRTVRQRVDSLEQRSANFFYKEAGGKYFWLCM